jgi:hypothetical protein
VASGRCGNYAKYLEHFGIETWMEGLLGTPRHSYENNIKISLQDAVNLGALVRMPEVPVAPESTACY